MKINTYLQFKNFTTLNGALEDTVSNVIESITILALNYTIAWSLVQERFENKLNIIIRKFDDETRKAWESSRKTTKEPALLEEIKLFIKDQYIKSNLPNHVNLADPSFDQPGPINILIGVNVFYNILSNQ